VSRSEATGAALYYLVHSTLVCGALFLLADLIVRQRGKAEDRFVQARRMCGAVPLGITFFVAALTVVGLPPFSGFVGKALVLQALDEVVEMSWIWPLVLVGGLAALIALSRAGTVLFWRISGEAASCEPIAKLQLSAILLLLSAAPLLVIFGGPVSEFTGDAAAQLHQMGRVPTSLLPGDTP